MPEHQDVRPDGTVAFLPHRLNRHPVVVRGLTADELWICAGLSGAAGLSVGIPLAIVFSIIAIAPTAIVLGIAAAALSVCVEGLVLSILFGVVAFSSFWSILEVFQQRERVRKGWFPENPRRKS